MPVFEYRTPLKASPQQVFDFILSPANLQAIAPPESNFVYVDPPQLIVLGTHLLCKIQAYGMVQQMKYEIVEMDPPKRYRENLVEGALKKWQHDYIVDAAPEGAAVLTNRIEFEPPGGMMGLIVTADRIMEALEDGFYHRSLALKKVFG
jgi:ligand-binding SRPBCC domain-containing protein